MEGRRRKEERVKFPQLEKKFEELRRLEEEYIKLPQLQERNKVRHLKKESFERPVLPDRTEELRRLEKENLQLYLLLRRLDKPRRLEEERPLPCFPQTQIEKEQPLKDFIEKPPRKNSLPSIHRHELNKRWLKACLDSVKNTKESRQNVLQWLQNTLKSLREKSYQAGPTISLRTWLVNCWITFEKEHPEEFMGDVANWLEKSLKHMEVRGPKTCALTPEEWLEASIQAIQNLLNTEAKSQSTLRWRGKSLKKSTF